MSNFPVLVVFDNSSFNIDSSNSIRFLAGSNSGGTDNVTEYNYEIEKWNDTGNCYIWVNVTEVYSASDTVFNMYYNNSGASDGQNVAGTWDSNYVLVQHLANKSGSIGGDLTEIGSVTKEQSGLVGNCSETDDVDNDDGYNSDGVIYAWDDTKPLTLMAVAKPDTTDSMMLLGHGHSARNKMEDQLRILNGKWCFAIQKSYAGSKYIYSNTAVSTSSWSIIHVTYDTSKNMEIFLNGVSDGTGSNSLSGDVATSDYGIFINPRNDRWEFNGKIDEARVSNIVRSDAWIKTTFHSINQTVGFLTFGSEQTQSAGATVPTVTTNEATGVEETNATIQGTLTDNGSADTTCWFRYGEQTPPTDHNVSQGVKADGASFSYNWQSLTPGKLYYFDTQANNSEGWDTTGGIKSFLTKPNAPTGASCSAGEGWTNVSWSTATGADKYLVRYKSGSAPTSVTDGTLLGNVTVLYINKSIGVGTHYFSIWSYAYETSPALHHYSDSYDTTSGTELTAPTWHSSSFGGSVTVDVPTWHSSSFGGSVTVASSNNAPILSSNDCLPDSGVESYTVFYFNVTWADSDGDSPTDSGAYLKVNISRTGWSINETMVWVSGSNTSGALYSYNTQLSSGDYSYHIWACDGNNGFDSKSGSEPSVSPQSLSFTIETASNSTVDSFYFKNWTLTLTGFGLTTEYNVSEDNQTGSVPALNITNTGNVPLNFTMVWKNNPGSGISMKYNISDNPPNPGVNTIGLPGSETQIVTNLLPSTSEEIWLWMDFVSVGAGSGIEQQYVNSSLYNG